VPARPVREFATSDPALASVPGRSTYECGQLFWPRLVRISSLVLAPPSGVVVVGGGVSSSVLAPPLCE
ncbi:MAG: hypothetical protein QOE32_6803, partial [Pseudonocardiales bacterium]|nr:hypothetical protein [Pseudonocardiales bacterium]